MKKKLLLLTTVCVMFFTILSVSAVTVTKAFKYDINTFTNSRGNYHAYQYRDIPSWSQYSHEVTTKIGGGWNYNRFEQVNYYTGGY